jgi:ATP-dependent Clp protease ATP-binding subunit ClpC
MASYRFPILVWGHPSGRVTAALVEDHRNSAAVAANKTLAVAQLKEMLQWKYRKSPQLRKPYFTEPELSWVKVEVRPEYRSDEHIYPLKETILLRLPCVRGTDTAGLLLCALPTVGIRFHFDDPATLPQLISHYVQSALKGSTPQQIARFLPPPSAELEDVVIQVRVEHSESEPQVDLEPLSEIADSLGARSGRGRLSRPWQRDEQVSKLAHMLQSGKGCVLLLGESGAGKSAVLFEAARKAERPDPHDRAETRSAQKSDDEPTVKVRHRFWLTNASRLISGMKYLGQWQQRCEEVIAKLHEIGGVLCVENLLELVRIGGDSPVNSLAAFLTPYLQRGELRLVGEATASELDACRRLLPAFAAVFSVVEIPAFSQRQAVAALEQLAGSWSQNLKVEFDRSAVELIFRLFSRFMPYQSFPGSAAAFTMSLFDRLSRTKGARFNNEAVIECFVQMTGLPELFLRNDRVLELQSVIDALKNRVIGQPIPCAAVASVVATFKAAMNDPGRPLGVMMFCGPTGVGKTELARTLSDYLFGHGEKKNRMVRLDMSEYAGPGAVERFIGPPHGEPSELIKRLREQPFTVVLLDEIEKASSEIFDLLLGVFDEGRLTDRFGRLTTFRSAIIVMTSNLGAANTEPFGLSRQPASDFNAEIAGFFRPEFFNRIDSILIFGPLKEQSIREIAITELTKVAQREGIRQRAIQLVWTDAVLKLICQRGYDVRYGARPLQRTIEHLIVAPLANLLVARPQLRKTTVTVKVNESRQIEFL